MDKTVILEATHCKDTVETLRKNIQEPCIISGPGSVVDIATGYGLDGPGIESRWG